jgi:hypothetical protein
MNAPERIWAWEDDLDAALERWWATQYVRGAPEYVRAELYTTALARAEKAEAELAKMADPNAVHVSMLAGTIAKLSWQQIKHIYAAEVAAHDSVVMSAAIAALSDEGRKRGRAEVERLREELSLIAVMGHSDDPKVAARIAYHAVERARAALLREAVKALESP